MHAVDPIIGIEVMLLIDVADDIITALIQTPYMSGY